MLKALRKKEITKKIILAVIAIFTLWGSGSIIRSRQKANYAGKIFGKTVSFDAYQDSYLATRNQALLQFGENFFKIEKYLNLEGQAWDRLILLFEAKKQGIKVIDKEVVQAIEESPLFQRDGKFDPKLYQVIIEYNLRLSQRAFEEQMRQSLGIRKLFEKETANLSLSEEELLQNYKEQNEQISVDYLAVLAADFQNGISASEEELKDFYQKNSSLFKRPLSINIEYIGIEYPKDATETDKQNILNKINAVSSKLEKEPDLRKVAAEFSLEVKETGLVSLQDPIPGIGWSPEFFQTAFNLKENQISSTLEIAKGCYILKTKEKKESYIPEFAEIKDKVKDALIKQKAKEIAKEKAQEYYSKLKDAFAKAPQTKFLDAAKNLGLKTASTELFKRNSYIPNIGMFKEFSDAAFALKDNQISPLVETPQGFYILKLKESVGIDEKKFAAEKEEFKKKMSESKKEQAFQTYFQELKNKANLQVTTLK